MRLDSLVRQLTIRPKKGGGLEPLRPNWAQHEFLETVESAFERRRPVRIIVLKARQLGISTITEAVMFNLCFILQHTFGLVMAHLTDSSEGLFQMTRTYWEQWPFRKLYTPKYHSKKELAWLETGSAIRIATASSEEAGRGRTINYLHASEVGFWDYPEDLMGGLRQTIPEQPGSLVVLESTANGVGTWFYNEWVAAEQGDSDYIPLFFPWWKHPEYCASGARLTLPPLNALDAEERALVKLGADDDHLAWRRWAINNLVSGDMEMFHQEYPSTPEEAFISAGTNVFSLTDLRECYKPMTGRRGRLIPTDHIKSKSGFEFIDDPLGPLTIFHLPSSDADWGQYFIGADPAHADGKDFACMQVINRNSYEQVAIWHGKIDPVFFADEIVKLGKFYNMAEVSPEVEGPGYATIGRIMSLDYPNVWRHRWPDKIPGKWAQTFGWSTTFKRKEWYVGFMMRLVLQHDLIIHDKRTFEEMRGYVTLSAGLGLGYGPADNSGHDDTVSSLGIAIICAITEGPLHGYSGSQEKDEPAWMAWNSSADNV